MLEIAAGASWLVAGGVLMSSRLDYAQLVEASAEDQSGHPFEEWVQEALDSLPPDLRAAISNVEIAIEEEPPPGTNYLGLYQGIPLTRRGGGYGMPQYSGTLPDKITVYRGPLLRHYGHDTTRLADEVRHVVWHEIAHHFGISDERLIEIDRY